MYPRSMFLSKNKKNITLFHLKFIIFKAVKNLSILHGRVFVLVLILCYEGDGLIGVNKGIDKIRWM